MLIENKNYSISIPNAWKSIVSNARVTTVEAGKIMLIALAYRSSLIVYLGVLVLEIEVSLLLPDVTYNWALSILIHHETLLGRSEYIRVMMNY